MFYDPSFIHFVHLYSKSTTAGLSRRRDSIETSLSSGSSRKRKTNRNRAAATISTSNNSPSAVRVKILSALSTQFWSRRIVRAWFEPRLFGLFAIRACFGGRSASIENPRSRDALLRLVRAYYAFNDIIDRLRATADERIDVQQSCLYIVILGV